MAAEIDQGFDDDISLDPQTEWELEQGIPQPDEPIIQKYLAGRQALIEQEKKQRHDRLFKQTMSPLARQAAKILSSIRKHDLKTIWTPKLEAELAESKQDSLFPGMMFSLARATMEKTALWKIIEKMPKGALLHAHMDAMIDADWLVDQAFGEPGCFFYADRPLLDEKSRTNAVISFRFLGPDHSTKFEHSVWSTNYIPNSAIPIQEAEKTFPEPNGFRQYLVSRLTITDSESLSHHHGLDAIWRKFTSCFSVIRHILFYEPIFRRAMRRLFTQLLADGITYIDFRAAFAFDFYLQDQTSPQQGYEEFFRIWGEEISSFKGANPSFQGARMIWTIIRGFDNRSIAESMKECIRLKLLFPHLICGFDCVGQEDPGRTLADLTPLLFWFRKKCYEAKVEIPYFFHAGECLGDGDSTDNNLFDAVLLGTRRIGHGYSLYKHPLLTDMVKDKNILVECCPISNEVLRLSSSILGHSLPALLSRGVAVSLNNDDPAILGHGKNGLTHDFWQAFMAFENLGLEGLATMAENSIKWCAVIDQKQGDWIQGINEGYLGSTIKAQMLGEWRKEFEKWCQWIIVEFAGEIEEDDDL